MRTVTQAATELGVSRTKIYNEIEKLNIITKKVSKNNYIEDVDFEKIKEIVHGEMVETNKTNETVQERLKDVLERDRNALYGNISDREYTDLKERIKHLEQQLEKKDQQIQDQADSLIEAMKFNNTLLDTNNKLIETNSKLNVMTYQLLESSNSEESITVETDQQTTSWLKRVFKKKK